MGILDIFYDQEKEEESTQKLIQNEKGLAQNIYVPNQRRQINPYINRPKPRKESNV